MNDDIADNLNILIFTSLIVFFLVFAGFLYPRYKCSNFAEITERESKYSFVNGCFIRHQKKWIHIDEYKYIFAGSDNE